MPDGVPAAAVTAALTGGGGELLARLELFDVYRGAGVPDGARSLAYRLRLQAPDRTLTDADVAEVREACIDRGGRPSGATPPGLSQFPRQLP